MPREQSVKRLKQEDESPMPWPQKVRSKKIH